MNSKKLIFCLLYCVYTNFSLCAPIEPIQKKSRSEQAVTILKGLGAGLITAGSAFFACMSTAKLLDNVQKNKYSVRDFFPRLSLALACAYTARQWAPYTKQLLLKEPIAYQDKRLYQDRQKATAYSTVLSALLAGSIAAHVQDRPTLTNYINKNDKLGATALLLPVYCTAYALYDLLPSIYKNIKPVLTYVKDTYWPKTDNIK